MTRRAFLAKALMVSALGATLTGAQGTTVRGRLYRRGPRGEYYPAPSIGVRLTHSYHGASSMSYTDNQGMYYLTNVPPGDFVLEVWLSKDNVMRFTIRALPQPFTDIAPIQVP
jgi:hypothetical protein